MVSFFLGSNFLGSMPATPLVDTGRGPPIFQISHKALCCPVCGEVWGRIMTDRPNGGWEFVSRPCRRCDLHNGSAWMSQAGSFLDPEWWNKSDLQSTNPDLPEALVRWEFAGLISQFKEQ